MTPAELKSSLAGSLSLRMKNFNYPIEQSVINGAIWESLTGKGADSFESLTRKWERIPIASQVYFYAAMQAGKRVLKENVQFISSVNGITDAENLAKDSEIRTADAVVGSVAALVNVIPVVGQAASAIIAIGYALSRLVYSEGLRIELRRGENQIRQSFAGDGLAYKGILLGGEITKSFVDNHPVSQSLPIDQKGAAFDFYVKFSDIEESARELNLYDE